MLHIKGNIAIPDDEIEITAIRAQGAGGQNVNKVASAVHLRFDIRASTSLPEICKARLLAMRDQRISSEGVVVIKAQQYRSLERNKDAALDRLRTLIQSALAEPKPRKPTKRSAASNRRRLERKARHAKLKSLRGAVDE